MQAGQTYDWIITGLSQPVVQWLAQWLKQPPSIVELRGSPLHLKQWRVLHSPTTYDRLLPPVADQPPSLSLSFLSPTSFRRKGNHFPLPVPRNLFHSYLRRWNDFSGQPVEQEAFLDWIDEFVIISRHLLADRITTLTTQFQAQRKRTGGDRATQIAETWATILARRELGESLQSIAQDLEMPYETVKTYAKLARRSLRPTS